MTAFAEKTCESNSIVLRLTRNRASRRLFRFPVAQAGCTRDHVWFIKTVADKYSGWFSWNRFVGRQFIPYWDLNNL